MQAALCIWAKCVAEDSYPAYGQTISGIALNKFHLVSDEELDALEPESRTIV